MVVCDTVAPIGLFVTQEPLYVQVSMLQVHCMSSLQVHCMVSPTQYMHFAGALHSHLAISLCKLQLQAHCECYSAQPLQAEGTGLYGCKGLRAEGRKMHLLVANGGCSIG